MSDAQVGTGREGAGVATVPAGVGRVTDGRESVVVGPTPTVVGGILGGLAGDAAVERVLSLLPGITSEPGREFSTVVGASGRTVGVGLR
jgi:hypothetical protein